MRRATTGRRSLGTVAHAVYDGESVGFLDARNYLLAGLLLLCRRGDAASLALLVDEEGVMLVGLVLELAGRPAWVAPAA